MSNIPETSRMVIFVGGPEDGRIVQGQEAFLYTVKLPVEPGKEIVVEPAEIGKCCKVHSSRLLAAVGALGTDACTYFKKLGVSDGNLTSNKYRLSEIIDGLYVYRFVDSDTF